MKPKHSPEQIVKCLWEAEGKLASGKTVEEVCRGIHRDSLRLRVRTTPKPVTVPGITNTMVSLALSGP